MNQVPDLVKASADAYFGIGLVAAGVFVLLGIVFLADAIFEICGWDPLGYWVMRWSRLYSVWVLFFSLVLGAMVGHFFTKPELWPLKEWVSHLFHS